MNFRRAAALALVGALAFGLAGCVGGTPPVKPSTSASAFASDEEAYKAAEKVYRDYVDALNKVDLADPKTFEPVFALTTGDANAADRKHFTQMHADGWTVGGVTRVTEVAATRESDGAVDLAVCTDVSEVTLIDAAGTSMVSPDRNDRPAKLVVVKPTPAGLKISGFFARDGEPKCG